MRRIVINHKIMTLIEKAHHLDKSIESLLLDEPSDITINIDLILNLLLKLQQTSIKDCYKILLHCDISLKNNKSFMEKAIIINGLSLNYASEDLQKNKELLLLAFSHTHDDTLPFVRLEFSDDKEVMSHILKKGFLNFRFIGKNLKNDRDFLLEHIQYNSSALDYLNEEFKNDKQLVLKSVNANGCSLQYASDSLKNDLDVVMCAIKNDSSAFRFASRAIKDDRLLILNILDDNTQPTKLDKECKYTVKNYFNVLDSMSDNLKDDREIILKAVISSVYSLKYASNQLRNDKEVVYKCLVDGVKHGWFMSKFTSNPALKFIGDKLKEEIGSNDPVKYLESYFFHKKLDNVLPDKLISP